MAKNKLRVAINGFGRIGRAAFKIALQHKNIEIVALNDLTDAHTLAYLLQYDTAYGKYHKSVKVQGNNLVVGRQKYPVIAVSDPAKLPWRKMKVDIVLECTGRFRTAIDAGKHVKAGAKRVIISAPAKGGAVSTYVLGVNHHNYKKEKIINNASCTTNCVSPVAQIMHSKFGVAKAALTTIHSYTADQRLQDAPHRDLRRARAAAENIVPTTTGAAIATTEVIPELKGLFDGIAVRVPTICGSLSDFTFLLNKNVTVAQVNNVFRQASRQSRWRDILVVTDDPLVSSDIIGNGASAIIDMGMTQVIGGNLVKIIAWYDNEWGYANRLVEMAKAVSVA
ncbi:MAG: type I glyceraldehyde-3-phosphate dehydrogenase [Candidatus Komeilibacteria bacterium]